MAPGERLQQFRLVATDQATGSIRTWDFVDDNPNAALGIASRHCRNDDLQLFADGRVIAGLRLAPSGYWEISPLERQATRDSA